MSLAEDVSSLRCADSTVVTVAELEPAEWRTLREMRLAALHDAPHAFVNSWAREWRMGSAEWLGRFHTRTWVVARHGAQVVGIACLAPPDLDAPLSFFVESVWVRFSYRRHGVLRQMLDELERLGTEVGATDLRLWVLDTNESAQWAYTKLGFSPLIVGQDTAKRNEDGSFVKEWLMSRPLPSA